MTNINIAIPYKIHLAGLLKKNNLQQSGLSNNRTLPHNFITKQHETICNIIKTFSEKLNAQVTLKSMQQN